MVVDMNYMRVSSDRPLGGRSDGSDEKVPSGLSSAQAAERAEAVAAAVRALRERTPAPAPERRPGVLGRLFGAGARSRTKVAEQT